MKAPVGLDDPERTTIGRMRPQQRSAGASSLKHFPRHVILSVAHATTPTTSSNPRTAASRSSAVSRTTVTCPSLRPGRAALW